MVKIVAGIGRRCTSDGGWCAQKKYQRNPEHISSHHLYQQLTQVCRCCEMSWCLTQFFSGGVVCPLESVMFTTSRPMGKRSVWTVLTYSRRCDNQVRSKPELIKLLGDTVDLSTFDYSTGTMNSTLIKPRGRMPKTAKDKVRKVTEKGNCQFPHQGDREDVLRANRTQTANLVPPIRQTASIFKQPVTVVKVGIRGTGFRLLGKL